MRRQVLAALPATLLLAAPAAWAATVNGTSRADRLAVHGNGLRDRVTCAAGRDVVTADIFDRIAADCEVVSRQLSRDPTTVPRAQHQTQVEPDSFAFGRTIVTTFQSGRFFGGAAAGIGWATSRDAGATWQSGFLPLTTERGSDPVVAYDAVHGVWLISVLSVSSENRGLQVSRSPDGLRWGPLVTVAEAPLSTGSYDKEWIACDNWPTSPFRGRCYLSYLNLAGRQLETRWSGDGGATWSQAASTSPGLAEQFTPNGALPVPRPDGSVVVGFIGVRTGGGAGGSFIGSTRSTDGGATFSQVQPIADLVGPMRPVPGMRTPALPSLDADSSGRVYAAWADCRFLAACAATDIVFATSADGVTWTPPTRVPTRNANDRTDAFVPALAVEPAAGRLAIAYYSLRRGCVQADCASLNVSVVQSADSGRTWERPQVLNAIPMRPTWLADTDTGRFVGDYISISWVAGHPVPVYSLASAPVRDSLRQGIFAATRVR